MRWFDLAFVALLAVQTVTTVRRWSIATAEMTDANVEALLNPTLLLYAQLVPAAAFIALWFGTSRRRSKVTRAVLSIVLTCLTLANSYQLAVGQFYLPVSIFLATAQIVLCVIGLICLYLPASRAWFRGVKLEAELRDTFS